MNLSLLVFCLCLSGCVSIATSCPVCTLSGEVKSTLRAANSSTADNYYLFDRPALQPGQGWAIVAVPDHPDKYNSMWLQAIRSGASANLSNCPEPDCGNVNLGGSGWVHSFIPCSDDFNRWGSVPQWFVVLQGSPAAGTLSSIVVDALVERPLPFGVINDVSSRFKPAYYKFTTGPNTNSIYLAATINNNNYDYNDRDITIRLTSNPCDTPVGEAIEPSPEGKFITVAPNHSYYLLFNHLWIDDVSYELTIYERSTSCSVPCDDVGGVCNGTACSCLSGYSGSGCENLDCSDSSFRNRPCHCTVTGEITTTDSKIYSDPNATTFWTFSTNATDLDGPAWAIETDFLMPGTRQFFISGLTDTIGNFCPRTPGLPLQNLEGGGSAEHVVVGLLPCSSAHSRMLQKAEYIMYVGGDAYAATSKIVYSERPNFQVLVIGETFVPSDFGHTTNALYQFDVPADVTNVTLQGEIKDYDTTTVFSIYAMNKPCDFSSAVKEDVDASYYYYKDLYIEFSFPVVPNTKAYIVFEGGRPDGNFTMTLTTAF